MTLFSVANGFLMSSVIINRPPMVYEDEDIVAVSKPAGITSEEVASDWQLAHRLDKDTSGVLILAKSEKALEFLRTQFKERTIKKKYLALVYGNVKEKEGRIETPIGKSKSDFRQKLASHTARGKLREAVTEYKVLKRFEDYTYLEVTPKTGRTHQIRVHLKSIGHPIVCDKLYAPGRACPVGLGRQALHAESIELELPKGGRIKLEADLPEDMNYDKLGQL